MDDSHKAERVTLSDLSHCKTYTDQEIAELRCEAWHELGVLIVSAYDERLTQEELFLLIELGDRLYEKEDDQ